MMEWLNAFPHSDSCRRVETLISLIQRVTLMDSKAKYPTVWIVPRRYRKKSSKEAVANLRKRSRLITGLNALLRRYAVFPRLQSAAGNARLSWPLLRPSDSPIVERVSSQFSYEVGESDVVRKILELSENGMIHQLQRCAQCSKWIFKHFPHQRFCSTPCQKLRFSHGEEFKRKRRDYMRKHRADNKQRIERQTKLYGRTGNSRHAFRGALGR